MFVGRENELMQLQDLYNSDKFQCVIIWGRRRVGKTMLMNEFSKDKDTIYYTGLETTSKENLENLSHSIWTMDHDDNDGSAPVYHNFKAALDAIYEMSKKKRVVFVLDEYPYLAHSYKGISSLLQVQIDQKYKDGTQLFLIICGSSMSFMEEQVLGYQSPLYGRRTAQFKILPFTFWEMKDYYHNFSQEDLAVAYGLTGGIPQYMEMMDDRLTIEDNIKKNFLTMSGYLYEEPTNLIKQELREPATYNAIIRAIATGSSKSSEICTKTDLESGALSTYISKLIDLGIVQKERPVNTTSSRKTIYSIKDSMFRFWYRFIPGNMVSIQRNRPDNAFRKIEKELPDFMGKVFEDICVDYLWEVFDTLPMEFTGIGRWWGSNPKLKREEELDILAYNDEGEAILGECKWTNSKVDLGILETLIERSKLLSYKKYYFFLFAKSGFTKGCIDRAAKIGDVYLISFSNMLSPGIRL